MELRMKNFNIFEVHWGGGGGGGHEKPIYSGRLPKKGGLDSLQI